MKVLVHDGIGIWLAARRLHRASSSGLRMSANATLAEPRQLDALVLGLPWQRMGDGGVITVV
jgi:transposase